MITKASIQTIGKEASQAINPENHFAPKVSIYQAESDSFPKVEIQIGKVLFVLNNSGAAIYYPDTDPKAKHLSEKIDANVLTESSARKLLANAVGLGVTLHIMEVNDITPVGQTADKLIGQTKEGIIEFDYSPQFQYASQTLLRVRGAEAKDLVTGSLNSTPKIYCKPNLIEPMAETLAIGTVAIKESVAKGPEVKREDSNMQKLEKNASIQLQAALQNTWTGSLKITHIPANTSSKIHSTEEIQAVAIITTNTSHVRYSGSVNAEGISQPNCEAKGAVSETFEIAKAVTPVFTEIMQELQALGKEKFPSNIDSDMDI